MDLEVRIESLGVAKVPGEDYNAEFYHVIDTMPLLDELALKGGRPKLSQYKVREDQRGVWHSPSEAKETVGELLKSIEGGAIKDGDAIPSGRPRQVNLEGLLTDLKRLLTVLDIAIEKGKRFKFFVT